MHEILEHQESRDRLVRLLDVILGESHRGAVLVGAAEVDRCLVDLLTAAKVGGKAKNGVLADRIKLARDNDLLECRTVDALNTLRDLRNGAAHGTAEWTLSREKRQELWNIGDGLPGCVEEIARIALLHSKVSDILASEIARRRGMTRDEALNILAGKAHHETLQAQVVGWELALGFSIVCALIDHQRHCLVDRGASP